MRLTTIFFMATKFLPNGILQHKFSQAERKSWEGVRSAHPHHSHRTPIAKPIRAIVGNVLTDIQSDFQADRSTLAITFPPLTLNLCYPPTKLHLQSVRLTIIFLMATKFCQMAFYNTTSAKLRENHGKGNAPLTRTAHKGHQSQNRSEQLSATS